MAAPCATMPGPTTTFVTTHAPVLPEVRVMFRLYAEAVVASNEALKNPPDTLAGKLVAPELSELSANLVEPAYTLTLYTSVAGVLK